MKNTTLTPRAAAHIHGGTQMPALHGTVHFYRKPCGVLVVAQIHGLPSDGFLGFHIHDGQNCSGTAFKNTGSHFNPGGTPHPSHAGDLPPLLSCHGHAYLAVVTDRFHIEDILGRTVVIHSQTDDFRTQPTGDAGTKIACGIIRKITR